MSDADQNAQDLFDSGLKDYNEKRFEEAVVKFRAAAAMGHGRAMNWVGVSLWCGEGVKKDVVEAYKWFKRSAEMGEPCAMCLMAIALRDGAPEVGINVDRVEAMRLMRMAADAGLADAMYELGTWLREANKDDDPAALEWFMKGAEAGNVDCMTMVGELHRIGACGLQPDYSVAVRWYERAAAAGDADKLVRLANTLQSAGDLVRSVELYERAVGSGSATAMVNLALCYENGNGVRKSAEKAVELYERASDLGNTNAMVNLGVCYENGDGVTKSAEKATELYQRASDLGDATAMVNLGVCYMNGTGVAASIRIGAELWLRGAALGESHVTQIIDSGMLEQANEIFYGVVTGMMSGDVPDRARARKLLVSRRTKRGRFLLEDFVFDGDSFPLDRIGDTLRLFAEFDSSIQSLQFATRLDKERPPPCSAEQQQWFNRLADLVGGAIGDDDDEVLKRVALLLFNEPPLEIYEALKRAVDARVEKLTVKSVLPLVCVLEELDRRVRSLEFVLGAGKARFVVRACVFGAMCEHLLAAELPSDLTSDAALETTLLWLGVVRLAEFFGRTEPERVAMVARSVEARLRNDKAACDKYAMILVRDLKRRVPHLLLATPEFAAASAAKLDGEIVNKRVKVILLGDSGAGKTQIRRRLGGVHKFQAVHTSTDAAEVSSVEVTSLTVVSAARWIERDGSNASENVKLHGPAIARSLLLVATGADDAQHTPNLVDTMLPVRASSSISGAAAPDVAPTTIVSTVAASSSASKVDVSETIDPVSETIEPVSEAIASTAQVRLSSTSKRESIAPVTSSSYTPAPLDFSVVDERKLLSLWDFGGQVEYFAVHDLFLTRGAVYVLVIDWTKGIEKARESAQRWMSRSSPTSPTSSMESARRKTETTFDQNGTSHRGKTGKIRASFPTCARIAFVGCVFGTADGGRAAEVVRRALRECARGHRKVFS